MVVCRQAQGGLTIMPFWLSALIKFGIDLFAHVIADARRDAELKQAGRAEQRAEDNKAAADAERRAAAVPESTVDETATTLGEGKF
jgi:hypothetical protein